MNFQSVLVSHNLVNAESDNYQHEEFASSFPDRFDRGESLVHARCDLREWANGLRHKTISACMREKQKESRRRKFLIQWQGMARSNCKIDRPDYLQQQKLGEIFLKNYLQKLKKQSMSISKAKDFPRPQQLCINLSGINFVTGILNLQSPFSTEQILKKNVQLNLLWPRF